MVNFFQVFRWGPECEEWETRPGRDPELAQECYRLADQIAALSVTLGSDLIIDGGDDEPSIAHSWIKRGMQVWEWSRTVRDAGRELDDQQVCVRVKEKPKSDMVTAMEYMVLGHKRNLEDAVVASFPRKMTFGSADREE